MSDFLFLDLDLTKLCQDPKVTVIMCSINAYDFDNASMFWSTRCMLNFRAKYGDYKFYHMYGYKNSLSDVRE